MQATIPDACSPNFYVEILTTKVKLLKVGTRGWRAGSAVEAVLAKELVLVPYTHKVANNHP